MGLPVNSGVLYVNSGLRVAFPVPVRHLSSIPTNPEPRNRNLLPPGVSQMTLNMKRVEFAGSIEKLPARRFPEGRLFQKSSPSKRHASASESSAGFEGRSTLR